MIRIWRQSDLGKWVKSDYDQGGDTSDFSKSVNMCIEKK